MTMLERLPLAILGRLVAVEEGRDERACVRAGVDPLAHTRCPVCRCRGVDLDCACCGGSGLIRIPF